MEHSLHPDAWEGELPDSYPKRDWLLEGIRHGFHIVAPQNIVNNVECDNYGSLTEHRPLVEKQINFELAHGHYQVAKEKPRIVSALGAIPKSDGKNIRLIHDCSRPPNGSVNSFALSDKFRYQSLQDAIDMITPGSFLGKVDLSQAYRVVKTHPSNHIATGLKFRNTYLIDKRLPFGSSASPYIFNSITQAVRAMIQRRGRKCVCFLDDFLIVCDTYEECRDAILQLIHLLCKLGFWINYQKVEGPSQRLTFLGITLDTIAMTLSLPPEKLQDLRRRLESTKAKNKVTKKQLQSLAGSLNWATQCIYGGRFHLRRILDTMLPLRKPWHHARITKELRADIDWWLDFMADFNGSVDMVDTRPLAPVFTDACSLAAGAYFCGDWVYTPWDTCWPNAAKHHINYKEVLALETATRRWAPLWRNKKIIVHTDNQAAVAIINRGHARDPLVSASLRRIFWASALFNFRLDAVYLPGHRNLLADKASRLHEPGNLQFLVNHSSRYFHELAASHCLSSPQIPGPPWSAPLMPKLGPSSARHMHLPRNCLTELTGEPMSPSAVPWVTTLCQQRPALSCDMRPFCAVP